MKRILLQCLCLICLMTELFAQSGISRKPVDVFNDSICFVYLSNGGIDAYEKRTINEVYSENGNLYVPLNDGDVVVYVAEEYDSCSWYAPLLPEMLTYKFNNKYNANLNVDVVADTVSDTIRFSLNAIGKRLTASFNLSDNNAVAYIDTVLQVSKETRVRFDEPVYYVVTYPGYNIMQSVKVSDEVWEGGGDGTEEINLTEDMLYTNKPSEVGDDLANMLDNNPATCFHTVYGATYDATVMPYITITLDNPVEKIKFYYMSRNHGNYNPMALNLYASDGMEWKLVKSFTAENDDLPLETAAEYTSPAIDLGGSYKYLKLEQTASEYHNNHMVFAEFRLYKVTDVSEPEKVQDAVYELKKVPFGRVYTIDVDWLTNGENPVPRIDINVDGGYLQIHNNKDTYYRANFRITGYGVYDDFEDSVNIKGRGNSTWSYSKKPYRLKFDSKRKPFGLTNGKSWVLLANAQTGALMANAIAMKAGQLAGAPYTNHIIPVDLYMDGYYVGSYMFTEKVGFGNNSVDVDDSHGNGYMLELDTYYDETYKFRTNKYSLPANVKEPDLSDYTTDVVLEKFDAIKNDFNTFETALYNGETIGDKIDLEACARFMLANDLVLNQELGHPKSTYLWREDVTSPDSKIIFGPLWDFDWAFGYESTTSYCDISSSSSIFSSSMYGSAGYRFFYDLMNNKEFKKYYYKVWQEFLEKGHIEELQEFIQDYYDFAESSFLNNYNVWYDGYNYESTISKVQTWLKQRHDYLLSNLEEYDITELLHTLTGDVDCNDELTVHDIVLTVAYLLGESDEAFSLLKADVDKSGSVDETDVANVVSQVITAENVSSLYYYNTPVADALLFGENLDLELNTATEMPIFMEELGSDTYSALQADIKVPLGVQLNDVATGERTDKHNVSLLQLGEDVYRLLIYSDNNSSFALGDIIAELSLVVTETLPEDKRTVSMSDVLVISDEKKEYRLNDLALNFNISTGISSVETQIGVRGGEYLTITALTSQRVDVYSVDGRMVRSLHVEAGTTNVELPAGVYVVMGNKVIIK